MRQCKLSPQSHFCCALKLCSSEKNPVESLLLDYLRRFEIQCSIMFRARPRHSIGRISTVHSSLSNGDSPEGAPILLTCRQIYQETVGLRKNFRTLELGDCRPHLRLTKGSILPDALQGRSCRAHRRVHTWNNKSSHSRDRPRLASALLLFKSVPLQALVKLKRVEATYTAEQTLHTLFDASMLMLQIVYDD